MAMSGNRLSDSGVHIAPAADRRLHVAGAADEEPGRCAVGKGWGNCRRSQNADAAAESGIVGG
jgi:hypothetical protein